LASDNGLPKAQFALGLAYFDGEGVKRDKARGLKLIRQAAKNGFTLAMEFLSEEGLD
jgi:TPR repeat protein